MKDQVETQQNERLLSADIATRRISKDYYSIFLDLPNPDPILKSIGRDIEVYEQLRNDSRVAAVVQSRKSAVLMQKWEVSGPRSEFYTDVFSKYKMHQNISKILDAVLYGYQINEIMWDKIGPYIVPVDLVSKPQRWFKFDIDNNLRFLTKSNQTIGVKVPSTKFIVASNDASYDNPYGIPALSGVFWPVSFRKSGLKWWLTFIEKYGMPWTKAKAPQGTKEEEIESMADTLANMVQDAVCVYPDDYEVEIIEANKQSSSQSFKMFMDFCNLEIAMSILGTNLTTEVAGGSYAASQTHQEVRFDLTESDTKIVEDAFNRLIEITEMINFGKQKETAKFNLYREEDIDKTLAERDNLLKQQGVNLTAEYYKRSYSLRPEDFTIGGSNNVEDTGENRGSAEIYRESN